LCKQGSNSKADITRVDAFTNASMGDSFCPDAFSPASYECWGCHTELHNVYLHCIDCQKKEYDYNVCSNCFAARRHKQNDKHHKKNHQFQMRWRYQQPDDVHELVAQHGDLAPSAPA